MRNHLLWTFFGVCIAFGWDLRAIVLLLLRIVRRGAGSGISRRSCVSGAGLLIFPFMQLAALHAVERLPFVHAACGQLPLGYWGAIVSALVARGASAPGSKLRKLSSIVCWSWATCGVVLAQQHRRLLSWPCAFWFGVGHRLEYDNTRWLRWSRWRDHFLWQVQELRDPEIFRRVLSLLAAPIVPNGRKTRSVAAPLAAASGTKGTEHWDSRSRPETDAAPQTWLGYAAGSGNGQSDGKCVWSGREVFLEWPPPSNQSQTPWPNGAVGGFLNGRGEAVCWQSWPVETSAALQESEDIAKDKLSQELKIGAEPPACTEPVPDSDLIEGLKCTHVEREWDDSRRDAGPWDGDARQRFENWWWSNKVRDLIDVPRKSIHELAAKLPADARLPAAEEVDPSMRRLCRVVSEVVGWSGCDAKTPLHGLDSLCVALVTTRLRAEFGLTSLSAGIVRRAENIAELQAAMEAARKAQSGSSAQPHAGLTGSSAASSSTSRPKHYPEYAVYFSPGQYVPMGGWVMRSDAQVDKGRMEEAVRRLLDRHEALRSRVVDPLNYQSFLLDTGITFTLIARWLDRGPLCARLLRRAISWALTSAWTRLVVRPRSEVYAHDESRSAFAVVSAKSQDEVEWNCKERRNVLAVKMEPVDVALVHLEAQLVGLWVCGRRGGDGDFAIIQNPMHESGHGLVYVDRECDQVAVLVGPGDSAWIPPPVGFPALLCGRIANLGVIWLRLSRAREMTVVWKPDTRPNTKYKRWQAFRMPGAANTVTNFDFIAVHALHSIADGHSFEPIVGDLLHLYASLASNASGMELPAPSSDGMAELQSRLRAALTAVDPLAFPQLSSLRGTLWRYRGKGYQHSLQLGSGAIAALRHASQVYGCPTDSILLALIVASLARAGGAVDRGGRSEGRSRPLEIVHATLYVPNRDGPGEASHVGLFSDWRDVEVRTDPATATIVGVILELAHLLRNRRWAIFNACHKPEVTMVNFQAIDAAPPGSRAGFVQLPEDQWRNGDRLRYMDKRKDELGNVLQALSVTVEQQDSACWWVHLTLDYDKHPPAWARRFVRSFQDAFRAMLWRPLQRVHGEFPAYFY